MSFSLQAIADTAASFSGHSVSSCSLAALVSAAISNTPCETATCLWYYGVLLLFLATFVALSFVQPAFFDKLQFLFFLSSPA